MRKCFAKGTDRDRQRDKVEGKSVKKRVSKLKKKRKENDCLMQRKRNGKEMMKNIEKREREFGREEWKIKREGGKYRKERNENMR